MWRKRLLWWRVTENNCRITDIVPRYQTLLVFTLVSFHGDVYYKKWQKKSKWCFEILNDCHIINCLFIFKLRFILEFLFKNNKTVSVCLYRLEMFMLSVSCLIFMLFIRSRISFVSNLWSSKVFFSWDSLGISILFSTDFVEIL